MGKDTLGRRKKAPGEKHKGWMGILAREKVVAKAESGDFQILQGQLVKKRGPTAVGQMRQGPGHPELCHLLGMFGICSIGSRELLSLS